MLALAALLQMATPDAVHQDIPLAFRGTWGIVPSFCEELNSPNLVRISARRVDFYERQGYLRLARLDDTNNPTSFYGMFDIDALAEFSTQRIRLDIENGKLFVSVDAGPSDEPTRAPWYRCSADPDFQTGSKVIQR